MTVPIVDEPVVGYDALKTRDLIGSRSSHSHGGQRLRKYKALSTDEVVAALRRSRARRVPVTRATKR